MLISGNDYFRKKYYAEKLSSHIKAMAKKSGLTEQEVYDLIHSDD